MMKKMIKMQTMKKIALLSQTKMNIGNQLILELMMMMIVMLTLNQTIVFHHVQNLLFQFAEYFLRENDKGKNQKYHSTTPAETSSEEEMTIGHKGHVSKDMEKKKMNTNPPSYVRIRPIIK